MPTGARGTAKKWLSYEPKTICPYLGIRPDLGIRPEFGQFWPINWSNVNIFEWNLLYMKGKLKLHILYDCQLNIYLNPTGTNLRDICLSRWCGNRQICNFPRQIAKSAFFREEPRNRQFSATNRDIISFPRQIAKFHASVSLNFDRWICSRGIWPNVIKFDQTL